MARKSMVRRANGEGGLIKITGCRYWYAQYYQDGRQVRVSTKTEVKAEALATLRRFMGDRDNGHTSDNGHAPIALCRFTGCIN